jgi:hypothetical protein
VDRNRGPNAKEGDNIDEGGLSYMMEERFIIFDE